MVTVIITTYMRLPEVVVRAVNSVIRQTYSDIEIIIVDDSPSNFEYRMDVYRKIMQLNDARIQYLFNEKNLGACASRNRAIVASHGEYIIYVDDDDELLEKCIEKRLQKFTNPKIGLVYSDAYMLDEETGKKVQVFQPMFRGMVFDELIKDNFIYAFPMVRRECYEKCGMFDVEMQAAQDYEMWLRIAQQFEVECINEPLAIVHLHAGERISKNPQKKIQGLERIGTIYREYLDNNPSANYIRTMKLIPYYVKIGDRRTAKILYLRAFKLYPFKFYTNLRFLVQLFQ